MKQDRLFCFVLSCWDLSNHDTSCCALGIFVRVHPFPLSLFRAMAWKLLIIELFSQWELNKIKTENCIWIWKHSWCCWKALHNSNLIEFISQFSGLRYGRYWFLSGFCWQNLRNSNKLQKLGLKGKISRALNLFTLGPTTHTTLMYIVFYHKLYIYIHHL
jgi:hypothetical protein